MSENLGQAIPSTPMTGSTATTSQVYTVEGVESWLNTTEGKLWIGSKTEQRVTNAVKTHDDKIKLTHVAKEEYDKVALESESLKKSVRIEKEIARRLAGTKYTDILDEKLDRSKIVLTEKGVDGLEGEVERLKGTYPDFFAVQNAVTIPLTTAQSQSGGGQGNTGGNKQPTIADQIASAQKSGNIKEVIRLKTSLLMP
jgi:hypothetical protein